MISNEQKENIGQGIALPEPEEPVGTEGKFGSASELVAFLNKKFSTPEERATFLRKLLQDAAASSGAPVDTDNMLKKALESKFGIKEVNE